MDSKLTSSETQYNLRYYIIIVGAFGILSLSSMFCFKYNKEKPEIEA